MSTLLEILESKLAKEGKLKKKQALGNKLSAQREHGAIRDKVDFPKSTPTKGKETLSLAEHIYDAEHRAHKTSFIHEHDLRDRKINSLVDFFLHNSFINLRNFSQSLSLFMDLFEGPENFEELQILLSQALDKKTEKLHKYGKAHISSQGHGKICLERSSYKLGYLKQYINIDFDKKDIAVCTVWPNKAKGIEFIRSHKMRNKVNEDCSIEFDSHIWKSFNKFGIYGNNYQKTLDCIERNHLNLEKFINQVNAKHIANVLLPKLINKPKIITNEKNTTFFDFVTSTKQDVSIKITKNIASIVVSEAVNLP